MTIQILGVSSFVGMMSGFLMSWAARGAVILAAAVLLHLAMRRASASTRHAVLALAVLSLAILPILGVLVPGISLPVLPERIGLHTHDVSASDTTVTAGAVGWNVTNMDSSAPPAPTRDGRDVNGISEDGPFPFGGSLLLVLVWGAGFLTVLSPTAVGLFGLWNRTRKTCPVTEPDWISIIDEGRERLKVSSEVRLLTSRGNETPMTWGLLRPAILIPAEANAWPMQRKCVVLAHELAHVKRLDWATHLLGRFICAVHWFNPLAWYVAGAMRRESECACDDVVLSSGPTASQYAEHLITLLRGLRVATASGAAIAMARPSGFERRVRVLLDGDRSRRTVSRRLLAAAALCAVCVAIVAAALQPTVRAESQPAATDQQSSEPSSTWSARLSSGAVVELVAIRRHGADEQPFWRPDGSPFADQSKAPRYDENIKTFGPEGRTPYQFVVVVQPEWGVRGPRVSTAAVGSSGGGGGGSASYEGRRIPGMIVYRTSLPSGEKTATLRVDLPSEDWKFLMTGRETSGQGWGGPRASWVGFSEAYEKDGKLKVTVALSGEIAQKVIRLSAIDTEGNSHAGAEDGGGGGTDVSQCTYSFPGLAPTALKEFTLEACEWETVTFTDVSLVSGQHTDCRAMVTPAQAVTTDGVR